MKNETSLLLDDINEAAENSGNVSIDSFYSSYREKLIEHVFIGDILKTAWLESKAASFAQPLYEISKPDVDFAGYDIIIEKGESVRHVQLKTKRKGSKTSRYKINNALAQKPAGCIIVIEFSEQMELGPFYFKGEKDGQKLKLGNKIAKHAKGNAQGEKKERPNIRVLNLGEFERLKTIKELLTKLFL